MFADLVGEIVTGLGKIDALEASSRPLAGVRISVVERLDEPSC